MHPNLMQAVAVAIFLTLAGPGLLPASAQGSSGMPSRSAPQPRAEIDKMDDSIKSYQDAVRYYQSGQFKLAEKELTDFLGKVGEHAGGNFMMGLTQVQLGDLEKARSSFRTTVNLDPAMVAPRGWLGAIEVVLGNPQAAADQRAVLAKMHEDCKGTCPKAADIAQGIQRIDENVAAASTPAAKPS